MDVDKTALAQEAISEAEVKAAKGMGFQVTDCSICIRPTLWKIDDRKNTMTPPKTCGRMRCGTMAQEPWSVWKAK